MSTAPSLSRQNVCLGVTPTLWWNDDFPDIDDGITFGQCVSEMALAGFDGCSVGHKYPTDRAVLKAALDLRGLRVSEPWVSTYFTLREMVDRTLDTFRAQMDFIKSMGATDMVVAEFGQAVNPLPAVSLFPNCPKFSPGQWDALLKGLDQVGRMAKDSGLRLCYHPHVGTGVMDKDDIDNLMAKTDPDLVHLLLDTGHLAFARVDPLAVTRQYGPRIKHIHLKDVRSDVVAQVWDQHLSFRDAIEAGVFTVPGNGAINFDPIFAALADAGFRGWLVVEAEQDPKKANPLTYAKMARSFLHQKLGW